MQKKKKTAYTDMEFKLGIFGILVVIAMRKINWILILRNMLLFILININWSAQAISLFHSGSYIFESDDTWVSNLKDPQ